MLSDQITRPIRRHLAGEEARFFFRATRQLDLPPFERAHLYLHVPFCRSMCPYCPYNRISYHEHRDLLRPFVEALLAEIDLCHRRFGSFEVPSIYIGGGTPTNLVDELEPVLERIRARFRLEGPVCIETTPQDVSPRVVELLEERLGVDLVSLGVQSFDDRFLELIGRPYRSSGLERAIDLVGGRGFASVNVDLMFALPGQTVSDVVADLERALATEVPQVTLYPLFTFPYSSAGRHLRLQRVRMPDLVTRRRMYRAIHDTCLDRGYRRVSVWGFMRGDGPRYSSVTREPYLGFGPGAATYVHRVVTLNTYSVEAYIETLRRGRPPVALRMDFTMQMERLHWLYWRLYDTHLARERLDEVFVDSPRRVELALRAGRLLGLCREEGGQISLTERGSFWIHLLQNYLFLNYVNTVWSAGTREAWPARIEV